MLLLPIFCISDIFIFLIFPSEWIAGQRPKGKNDAAAFATFLVSRQSFPAFSRVPLPFPALLHPQPPMIVPPQPFGKTALLQGILRAARLCSASALFGLIPGHGAFVYGKSISKYQ